MGKFNDWFTKKLKVSRFPLPQEIKDSFEKNNIKHVINVSDEFIIYNADICTQLGIYHHWFPLNECGSNMGMNNIYAALQILWIAEHKNQSVILHCHAGSNRSVTVAQLYYLMRTKTHFVEKEQPIEHTESILKMFNITDENEKKSFLKMCKQNRVQNNIEAGHLVAIGPLMSFLNKCEENFKAYICGNISLDKIKLESKTENY